jgi:hypothetical protein
MITFTHTFAQIVTPDLVRLIDALAPGVPLGVSTFGDVCRMVTDHAMRRGASRLPEATIEELIDWIGRAALIAVDREEKAQEERKRAAVERWGEPARQRQARAA